jgi:ribosome maturation factor RimP
MMLNTPQQLETLRQIAEPVCQAHGLSLVDVRFANEHGGLTLRVLIERLDQPEGRAGVSLGDCQSVSRDLSTVLDVEAETLVPGRYRLEVGSPGIERPLVSRGDFERFAGREVRVQSQRPLSGRRRFQGTLRGLAGEAARLEVDAELIDIPLADITKAHLVFRFDTDKRQRSTQR